MTALTAAFEDAAAAQGMAALARVSEAGDAGYLPGSGTEAQVVIALCRMRLVTREIETPDDAPEIAGVKATRWRYRITDAGRRMLNGEDVDAGPAPILDAEEVTDDMAAKRAELAAGRREV
jgi:hypothetical protein